MVRTYDRKGLKINSRRAENIAEGQAVQHQGALQQNQQAGQVVEREAAPYIPNQADQDALRNSQLTSPQPQGVIAQNREERLADATPEQRAQNQQNLKGIMNPGFGVTPQQRSLADQAEQRLRTQAANANIGPDETAIANARAAASTEETQRMEQEKLGREKQQQKQEGDALASLANPQDGGMAAALGGLPPEAAHLAPFFQNLLTTLQQTQQDQASATQAMLNGGTIDVNGQPVQVQGINAAYDEMDKKIKDMESGYTKMQEGIQGMLDKAYDQEQDYLSQQEQTARERLAWNETQILRQAAKEKQSAVDSKIAELALKGRIGSDGGMAELEETRMAYESRMDDIKTEFGVQRTDLAAKFTGLYLEASNKHLSDSIANIKDTAAAMERIAGQSLSSKQARLSAQTSVLGDFVNQQAASRKEYAGALKDIASEIDTVVNRARDDKRAQELIGWQRLEGAIKSYGSYAPPALLDSIGKMLPGVDVRSVATQMTLAEMKQFKVGKMGGGGGGGFGSGAASYSDPTGIASQYANMNPQELSSAVDRAMLKFGGTGAERNRKRNEYMDRIASGESTGNIVSDLIKDYWATTTGTNETTHNQRTSAAGNMDAILSYADAYGVTADNDGPLGPVDSRQEWLRSFFGASSDAYTDIRSLVSNVKGQITKANAGTAVSTYELSLLKEYVPSMDLKGPTFFANARNYKALVNYLDAKQAAIDLGLPPPPLPQPIKHSGNAIAGPGKYSEDDINSALLE